MPLVMIVDDSSFARANLRRSFEAAGYDISEAASGQKALELVQNLAPDLVTLDLLMPGMNGMETLKAMQPLCPKARFLVISADIQNATRQELINAGAHGFLNKPVARDELIAAAARLLGDEA